MLRRSTLLAALTAVMCCALLVLVGCAKKNPAASSAEAAASSSPTPGTAKKILHFSTGAEPKDLDFQIVTGTPEHRLALTFFEGLVSEDPQLNIIPGVAEKWEISADGLVYTFHLRADAKWSNGDPITADDFVQTYRRMITPALAAEYAYMLWHVVGAEDFNKGQPNGAAERGLALGQPNGVWLWGSRTGSGNMSGKSG